MFRKALALAAMTLAASCAAAPSPAQLEPGAEYVVAGVGKDRTPWFVRHAEGIMKGATENGLKAVYAAARTAKAGDQAKVIDECVKHGAKALLVVPNSADQLVDTFTRARAQGIAVVTHESPFQVSADADVEMVEANHFGTIIMNEFARLSKRKAGSYALFVGSLSVPGQNKWAAAAVKWQRAHYPNLKLVAKIPVAENRIASAEAAKKLMHDHKDLVGIISLGSEGAPGVAKALRKAGDKSRELTVIGVTTPNVARDDVNDGYIDELILWDPAMAGKIQAYVAKMLLDGRRNLIRPGFEVPGFGAPEINGNTLIFDKPLIIGRENIGSYDF
jgi:simple sugar transport system substrate-binding protein